MSQVCPSNVMGNQTFAGSTAVGSRFCAFFQSADVNFIRLFVGTMTVVPIFLIFAAAVLARIIPVVLFLFLVFLAAGLLHNLNTP